MIPYFRHAFLLGAVVVMVVLIRDGVQGGSGREIDATFLSARFVSFYLALSRLAASKRACHLGYPVLDEVNVSTSGHPASVRTHGVVYNTSG